MITVNDTAFVRTTNEEVYVISIAEGKANVRRPIMTQNGIQHVVETFLANELETIEDRVVRDYTEKKNIQALIEKLAPESPNTPVSVEN